MHHCNTQKFWLATSIETQRIVTENYFINCWLLYPDVSTCLSVLILHKNSDKQNLFTGPAHYLIYWVGQIIADI